MEFEVEKLATFLSVFDRSKAQIRAFEGCLHLALFSDPHNPNVRYTYSHWVDEAALERYRQSELFRTTWAATKVLFATKAQAFSMRQAEVVG